MLALDLLEPDQAIRLAGALCERVQRLRWVPALNVTAGESAQALDMLEEVALG